MFINYILIYVIYFYLFEIKILRDIFLLFAFDKSLMMHMIHQEKQISLIYIYISLDIEVRYWMSNKMLTKQIY